MNLILIILIFFTPCLIIQDLFFNFVIWNVGQGSWATYIEKNNCYHIDMGGETAPLPSITKLCRHKNNILFLTHLDWDHINKIKYFEKQTNSFCLINHSGFKKTNRASLWLRSITICKIQRHKLIKILHRPTRITSKNQSSIVYLIKDKILISGDSPQPEEKIWAYKLPNKKLILILGHHGSYTSTSSLLLKRLRTTQAIASARKRRFGHPHKKVIKRLKKFKIPLLTTQDWGSIHFEL